jgi:class 3 adenylate cyclase/tetratricopeptide (TPR) repeat protein
MEGMSHRFAAVLAADVARYSRLMESDGEGTVQALKGCRDIFQRCVTEHHGREFGSVGDSLMAEFPSPVEALRAAHCIQRDFALANEKVAEDSRLEFRIGLHMGDVISDSEDVFADVVNTAARLQELAVSGGIVVSGLLHEQVKKEPGLTFRALGQQYFKNITEPVHAYELESSHTRINWHRARLTVGSYRSALAAVLGVLATGLLFVAYFEAREPKAPGPVIEVPGPAHGPNAVEIAAHGEISIGRRELHRQTREALQRALRHFEKATDLDPDNPLGWVGIADALGGSPDLADANSERVVVRRNAAIEKALALDPNSGEAYAARAYMNFGDRQFFEAEMNALRAIRLSPDYADAHFVYSQILYQLGRLEEAVAEIREANRLGPDVPVFINLLGTYLWKQGRVEEAHKELIGAVREYPDFVGFYKTMSEQLVALGRYGEALLWINAAVPLAPTDEHLQLQRCYSFMSLNDVPAASRCIDDSEALSEISRLRLNISLNRVTQNFDENARLVQPYLSRENMTRGEKHLFGTYFLLYGAPEKALEFWRELEPEYCGDKEIEVDPRKLLTTYWVAATLQATGNVDRANYLFNQMLRTMESMHRTRGVGFGPWDIHVYAALGEFDKAIDAAVKAHNEGYVDPAWWNMRMPMELNDYPEWHTLINESLARIEEQRRWYEEHKNDLPF